MLLALVGSDETLRFHGCAESSIKSINVEGFALFLDLSDHFQHGLLTRSRETSNGLTVDLTLIFGDGFVTVQFAHVLQRDLRTALINRHAVNRAKGARGVRPEEMISGGSRPAGFFPYRGFFAVRSTSC